MKHQSRGWRLAYCAGLSALLLQLGASGAFAVGARTVQVGVIDAEGHLVPNVSVRWLGSDGETLHAESGADGILHLKGVVDPKATLSIEVIGAAVRSTDVRLPANKTELAMLVYLTPQGSKVEFGTADDLLALSVAPTAQPTLVARHSSASRAESVLHRSAAGAGSSHVLLRDIAACAGAVYENSGYDAGSNALRCWRAADDSADQWIVDDVALAADATVSAFHWLGNEPFGFNWSGETADYIILNADGVGGTPGTLVTEVHGVGATRFNTGDTLFGDPVWEYSITGLAESLSAGDYWIGVRPVQDLPLGTGAYDVGWWITSFDNGTDECFVDYGPNTPAWDPGNTVFGGLPYEVAFCVVGATGPAPYGACCNDTTGACEDCTQGTCPPTSRFTANTTCDDMAPACGAVTGACCDPVVGGCAEGPPTACAAVGGLYQGDWTTCAGVTCPCVVSCPAGSTDEGEANCGLPEDTVNGGCNSPVAAANCCLGHGGMGCDDATCEATVCGIDSWCCTNAWDGVCADLAVANCGTLCDVVDYPYFSPIACGETVCGSGAFDGTLRDTDWYKFTITEETEITWTVEAAFPVLAGIVDTGGIDDCSLVSAFLVSAVGGDCEQISLTACLAPGTWYVFVAPDFLDPVACETDYTATLTCADCPSGACCPGDGSCSVLSQPDCDAAGGDWSGAGTNCVPNECPQPPPNDDCATATAMTANGASELGNNTAAADDVTPTCGTSTPGHGMWYSVVGTGNTMTATTCNAGSDFDTKIQVFCDCDPMVCVAGSDDSCTAFSGLLSTASWCSEAGKTYYIIVGGYSTAVGNFELSVTDDAAACDPAADCGIPTGACCDGVACVATETEAECIARPGTWYEGEDCATYSCPVPIDNETCDTATDITSVPYSTTFDNDEATADGPGCGFASEMQNDVWFSYTPTEDCTLTATIDPDYGSGYDGVAAVWSGPDCATLVEELCFDDPEPYVFGFAATAGTTYWFEIGDYGSTEGGGLTSFDLDCQTTLATGACCIAAGACVVTDSLDCASQGGTYEGDAVACNPCPQPPANDECSGATDLAALPATDIVDVTQASDDITASCGMSTGPYKNVWYTVTGTGNTMTATTCGAGTAVGDTKISVFCKDCADQVCVAGNDDDCAYLSTVSWCSVAGQTYYVTVGLYSAFTAPGDIQLDVSDDGVGCSGGVDCNPLPDYCAASGGCDEYISNVTIGAINNDSACDGYGDHTSLSADLQIGVATDITVTIGNGYSSDEGGLWIDWNQDLDFDDADETITTAWAGSGPYTIAITPPAGAAIGSTRLRARVLYFGPPSGPCGDSSYGEVEDYTVNVAAARGGTGGPWDDDDGDGIPNFCDTSSAIPTVSEWGLVLVALLGLVIGSILFGRRQVVRE